MEQLNGVLSPAASLSAELDSLGVVEGAISNAGYDMSGELAFLGVNAKDLGEVYSASYELEDTDFDTWTPSSTASVIVASNTLANTVPIDLEHYDYILDWKFKYIGAWVEGATLKAMPIIEAENMYQAISKRPSSVANIEDEVFNNNFCATQYTAPILKYYDANGAVKMTYSATYGFYIGAVAATFSGSTTDTPNLTIKTPTISARCSNTYFSTARAAEVDKTVKSLWLSGRLYRVNKGAFMTGAYREVVENYNEEVE